MNDLPARFAQLSAALNGELLERREEIDCALRALVAGCSFFMVGEPGIAKSLLARRVHAYISDAEFFDHDMDRFSVPEDVFGPRSLSAMKEDRWERAVEGTLVTADFAMLDELFEASSALLKSLLRALNERTFHQGTEIIPMRLTTVFVASNAIPTDPRLAAIYDRLLIRRQLHRVHDTGNFVTMLTAIRDEKPDSILSWEDVLTAQREATRVVLPDEVLTAVATIRRNLADEDIYPSDRRFVDAMRVVRATAWLDGCAVAEPEHLRCLQDMLWQMPEQFPTVTVVIDRVLEPLISEIDKLIRDVADVRGQVRRGLPDLDRKRLATELADKIRDARRHLRAIERKKGSNAERQRIKIGQAEQLIADTARRIMEDLYEQEVT
jgi:MoxR-like ATPase